MNHESERAQDVDCSVSAVEYSDFAPVSPLPQPPPSPS